MLERKVIIGNNGIDLHIVEESFDAICTADCKKSASDIKTAWNATYGAGINPDAVPDMLKALETANDYMLRGRMHTQVWEVIKAALNKAKL
jgi:hypothetical protein